MGYNLIHPKKEIIRHDRGINKDVKSQKVLAKSLGEIRWKYCVCAIAYGPTRRSSLYPGFLQPNRSDPLTPCNVQKSRITYVDGIPVLKSNMYDLNQGEPSVYHEVEEKKKARKRRWMVCHQCDWFSWMRHDGTASPREPSVMQEVWRRRDQGTPTLPTCFTREWWVCHQYFA